MNDEERPAADDDPDPAADESGGMGTPRLQDAPHLLIVESIRSTRELMGLVLKRHYEIQTAATYEQALRRIRTTQFDGVVVGVNLQGVEAGTELIEELRAAEGSTTVPIIALIGPPADEVRKRLAAAGADDFLRMPFVRSDLLEILHHHLQESRRNER